MTPFRSLIVEIHRRSLWQVLSIYLIGNRDPWALPYAHERLALLYEEAGDIGSAARHAAAFVTLWENADPEIQPRVQSMRAWLQRTLGDR
jgi:hypothetical protein